MCSTKTSSQTPTNPHQARRILQCRGGCFLFHLTGCETLREGLENTLPDLTYFNTAAFIMEGETSVADVLLRMILHLIRDK